MSQTSATPVPAMPEVGAATNLAADPLPVLNGKEAIRIGGDVKAPERIRYVPPVYPEIAANANVGGVVIINALIDDEGNVVQAKVIRSVPLLDQASLDAVLQWKYVPTRVNGVAVPVVMTVTVNFSLR
jgi:protein TonB